MIETNCNCQIGCTGKAVIASVIIGILAAFFRFTALVTITPAFLWVLFGIAIGFLGITLLSSSTCNPDKKGCCTNLGTLLAGILGTVLTSVILLGITFAATSVTGAIITGLLLFFFSLLITSSTCLIRCRYNCD
ncbi:MAG: hypothetical protein IKW06_00750 [Clostridia bacterium]|nr:hypothetical protein [Clostridia bacterium]